MTLDQFAVFAAVVDHGSFSAAARALHRAQSAITYAVHHLEQQTGMALFDRTTYRPTLTPAGRALLPRARRVLEDVAAFRTQSRSLVAGHEARITLAIDIVAPAQPLTAALVEFARTFPMVEVAILAQPMDATLDRLRRGDADLGLVVDVPAPAFFEGLARVRCGTIDFVVVAAPHHALARMARPLSAADLRDHTQILLSSGLETSGASDWAAYALNRWRVNDLGLRHSLLLAGAGWSSMPRHLVADDLGDGRLIALRLDRVSASEQLPQLPLSVAHRKAGVLGPAALWLRDRLVEDAAEPPQQPRGARRKRTTGKRRT